MPFQEVSLLHLTSCWKGLEVSCRETAAFVTKNIPALSKKLGWLAPLKHLAIVRGVCRKKPIVTRPGWQQGSHKFGRRRWWRTSAKRSQPFLCRKWRGRLVQNQRRLLWQIREEQSWKWRWEKEERETTVTEGQRRRYERDPVRVQPNAEGISNWVALPRTQAANTRRISQQVTSPPPLHEKECVEDLVEVFLFRKNFLAYHWRDAALP